MGFGAGNLVLHIRVDVPAAGTATDLLARVGVAEPELLVLPVDAPLVRERVPGVKLVIVGDGDHRPELERLSQSLGIASDVRFTGYVSEKEKVRLLRQIWLVLNSSSKEGWGLTVIEANACRTAVVGSDVPGLRDAIRDGVTGLLYPYGDVRKLADLAAGLLVDAPARARLAGAAYDWSLTFDWNVVAKSVLSHLEEEIASRSDDKN